MKKRAVCLLIACALVLSVAGCNAANKSNDSQKKEISLDPKHPVTIHIWHYYNGAQQTAFNSLVKEFNTGIGKEKGIYVEGHSQGDVPTLEQSVRDSASDKVGSDELPEIFSSYADTAYEIEKAGKLADLSDYLSKEEIASYVDSYIDEGKIGQNGELRIFPVAKSSEIMMMNKTDWDKFAEATGASVDELGTIEGVCRVAEEYYNWTDSLTPDVPNDGKAFYGRDSIANLFVIGSMQLGEELFQVENGKGTLKAGRENMKKIWENYYVPYIKGYFYSYGKFRSDDVKIGELLAFTGSTTASMYFPDRVELETDSYPIDYTVIPAPVFADGQAYAVQQGAGMVVTKTSEEKEFAAVEFLKWFTKAENNIRFACASGYLPVKKEALSKTKLDHVIKEQKLEIPEKTYDSLVTSIALQENAKMYTNKAFEGGYEARSILEHNLSDKASKDRAEVIKRLESGMDLEEACRDLVTEEAFEAWYESFTEALKGAVAED